jgi:hypothetical protein
MAEKIIGTMEVRRVREFESLMAISINKTLKISYIERTFVGDEEMKVESKSYNRPYDQWATSQLGTAILGMINLDLNNENPGIPNVDQGV